MSGDLYIGIISGTSMDALDAVLVEIKPDNIQTVAHHSRSIPNKLKSTLLSLCTPGQNEIQISGEADAALGIEIANVVNELIAKENIHPSKIVAIGSHGQTIRHSIESAHPFTLQIGNPSIIAEKTGITTVADFRMADIAAGGQGAPLACLLHEEVFRSTQETRVVLNLGGIANITLLEPGSEPMGYDTGTANTLMDQWILKCKDQLFDRDGEWARSGEVIDALLEELMQDPYITQNAPKSTGREYFHLEWLDHFISGKQYAEEDIQRTLLEYSARSISQEVKNTTRGPCKLLLCGGGVYNTFLVERLQENLPGYTLGKTDELGIHSQQVEAAAFALIACKTMNKLAGNLPSVTGANGPKILGGIYLAS